LVISESKRRGSRRELYWNCICECGTETEVRSDALRKGSISSCGCIRATDLQGRIFGELKVLNRSKKTNAHGEVYWTCRCVCGKEKAITANGLRSGYHKSCGCRRLLDGKATKKLIPGIGFDVKNPKGRGTLASLDRIDSNKSYTKENCQWVSKELNIMKGALSMEDFALLCNVVSRKQSFEDYSFIPFDDNGASKLCGLDLVQQSSNEWYLLVSDNGIMHCRGSMQAINCPDGHKLESWSYISADVRQEFRSVDYYVTIEIPDKIRNAGYQFGGGNRHEYYGRSNIYDIMYYDSSNRERNTREDKELFAPGEVYAILRLKKI